MRDLSPVTLRTSAGFYVTAEGGGGSEGHHGGLAMANRTSAGAWEELLFRESTAGKVGWRAPNGAWLCAEPGGVLVFNRHRPGDFEPDAWEGFTPVPMSQDGRRWAYRTDHGTYVVAEGGGGGALTHRHPNHAPGSNPGVWETLEASEDLRPPSVPAPPAGHVDWEGYLRPYGRCWGDDRGPRIVAGATCFPLLCQWRENQDEAKRQMDRTVSAGRPYLRVAWRLNGRPWDSVGLTVDPLTQPGYEALLRGMLVAAWERGLRIMLTCCDMYSWTDSQAEHWHRAVGQIAASVNELVVIANDGLNEMRGTHPGGESDEAIQQMEHLMSVWRAAYPWGQVGISDPADQAMAGMQRMSRGPATMAQIHDVRWHAPDAIRHGFNTRHDNWPGKPLHQREPAGPNSPGGHPNGYVYQPINDVDDLFAIYTVHAMTGQMSTYFNDPALINRAPLDSTWGFRELPALWAQMGIPPDIGNGQTHHGLQAGSPMDVGGSHAARADAMVAPDGRTAIGVISGSHDGRYPWQVRARWDAEVTRTWPDGDVATARYSAGQVIDAPGPEPAVLRFDRL